MKRIEKYTFQEYNCFGVGFQEETFNWKDRNWRILWQHFMAIVLIVSTDYKIRLIMIKNKQ